MLDDEDGPIPAQNRTSQPNDDNDAATRLTGIVAENENNSNSEKAGIGPETLPISLEVRDANSGAPQTIAVPRHQQPQKSKQLMLGAWLATCAADAASTHVALGRGAHEVLLTQQPWVNNGLIAAEAVAVAWAAIRLQRTHPKLATVLLISAIGVRATVAVHNVHALQVR